MGSNQSAQVIKETDEEEEEDDGERNINGERDRLESDNHLLRKVLEQEPEMLPCLASASPPSPQLSSLGTPRLGPSIKASDPYNVLAPPPPLPPPPVFSRSFSANAIDDDQMVTEVYLISHGGCE